MLRFLRSTSHDSLATQTNDKIESKVTPPNSNQSKYKDAPTHQKAAPQVLSAGQRNTLHEVNKTAVIVGMVGVGALAYMALC